MNGVNEYKATVIGRLYKGLQGLIKSRKITVFEGYGKLVAKDTVEVNGERVTGEYIVLGTGSYARSLPGLEIGGRVITSDQALQLDWVPKSVDRARRRRHRLGVRQRLEVLRRGRHDHRGAPPPRRQRGRGAVQGVRARSSASAASTSTWASGSPA